MIGKRQRLFKAAWLTLLVIIYMLGGVPAYAATGAPYILNYQGRLMDSSGNLLGGAGTQYCFKFSLFDNATVGSGTKLWPTNPPSRMAVTVQNGVFNVGIGDTNAGGDLLDYNFNDSDTVYLNVDVATKVDSTCDGTESYETLSPRERIFSSGYAINANTVGGFTPSQNPTGNNVPVLSGGNLTMTGGITASNATTTNATSTNLAVTGNASTSNLTISNGFTFGNFSGILKSIAGVVSAALVNLASDVTGILPVGNGGTGWSNVAAGAILFGNGSGALSTTTPGAPGQIIAYLNGIPTWTSTTTYSGGLSYLDGVVTNTGVVSIAGTPNQIAVSGSTGAVTVSLPTQLSIGYASTTQVAALDSVAVGRTATTTIRGEANATSTFAGGITAPSIQSGSASTSNLIVSSASNGFLRTDAQGLVSATSTFGASSLFGVVGIGNGGTGTSTAPSYGKLLIGNAQSGYDLISTSTLGIGSAIWGNITGTLSDQGDLQAALDAKLSLTNWYATTTDGLHEGTNNLYFTTNRAAAVIAGTSTDALKEGSTNLYYTDRRVASVIAGTTTSALAEGNNLYFTSNRVAGVIAGTTTDALAQGVNNKYYSTLLFATDLAGTTTDALREGTINKYYSNTSVNNFIAGSTTIAKLFANNTWTGTNNFTNDTTLANATATNLAVTGNASTSNFTVSSGFIFGSGTGILKAIAGVVSSTLVNLASDVTGILPVANGGTGWSNVAAGAILFGNGGNALSTTSAATPGQVLAYLNGVPTWVATSTYSYPLLNTGNTITLGFGTTTNNTWVGTQTFANLSAGNGTIGILTATSSALLASTTAQGRFIAGNIVATSTATSTFAGSLIVGTSSSPGNYLVSVMGSSTAATSATGTAIMAITNTNSTLSSGTNLLRLNIRTPFGTACSSTSTCPRFTEYFAGVGNGADSGGGAVGSIRLSTAGTGITQISGAADFGEYMQINSAASVGDLISLNPQGQYQKAVAGQSIIGVVSDNPAFVGNGNLEGTDNAYVVGFAGVIETSVSTDKGNINAGDLIAAGDTPGVGVKLVNSGYALGQALESYSGGGVGTIKVLVLPKYVDASVALDSYGGSGGGISGYWSLATTTGRVSLASTTYALYVTNDSVFANATTTNLFSTTASSTNLFAAVAHFGSAILQNALGIGSGGTGTTTAPTYGKLLIGNSGGSYDLISTSSLGITSAVWGNITGTLSDQGDLQAALDAKLSLTNWYATTTDGLHEGTNNLYFTNNRVASVIAGTTTDALAQGSVNKYYATNLFAADLAGTSTDALKEGTNNQYFTNARVASYINGSSTIAHAAGSAYGDILSWTGTAWATRATSTLAINSDNVVEGLTNLFFTPYRVASVIAGTSTDALKEGNNNLYFTNNRVAGVIAGTTTDALAQGINNKYYSTLLFAADLAGTTTDALREGTNNKYYTDVRVNSFIAGSTTIAKLFTANAFTALQSFGSGLLSQASSTFSGFASFTGGATTSNFTISGIAWLPNLTGALLSTDATGKVFATTSIGANLITGSIATINGQPISANAGNTISAASSSLLGDNNTLTGTTTFANNAAFNASTTFARVANFQNASSSLSTLGAVWLPSITASAILSLDNAGKVSASSTVGANVINVPANSLLSGDSTGKIIASTTVGWNLIKGAASSIFGFDSSGNAIATTSIGANILSVPANSILAGDQNGKLVASSSIGANLLSGVVSVSNGGTGSSTPLGGILTGNGSGAITSASVGNGLSFTSNSLSCLAASGTINGCLSSTDWTTFNGKLGSSTINSLTQNFVARWNGSAFINSSLYDDGSYIAMGTSTPANASFTIGTSSAPQIALSDNNPADFTWAMRTVNNIFYLATSTDNATSSVSAFTILNNGRVGFGTSSPGTQFGINGVANFSASTSTFYNDIVGDSITLTGNATSSFNNGVNLNTGCFSVGGTCIGATGPQGAQGITGSTGGFKLATTFATTSAGTTTVQFTGSAGSPAVFTPGNPATLVLPSDTAYYIVEGWGGGGGGGGETVTTVSATGSPTCFSQSSVACNNASTTAPTAIIYAGGGSNGSGGTTANAATGGVALFGSIKMNGGNGLPGQANTGVAPTPSGGSSPRGGTGGVDLTASGTGTAGNAPGGGGGGGHVSGTGTGGGGAGGAYAQNTATTSVTTRATLAVGAGGAGGTGTQTGGAGANGALVIYVYTPLTNVLTGTITSGGLAGQIANYTGDSTVAATSAIMIDQTSGNVGIATTTPGSIFSINNILNATAATSTFYGDLQVRNLNVTGTATSTHQNGINITAGCFSVGGVCLANNSLSLSNPNTWSALQTFSLGFVASASSTINGQLNAQQASTTLITTTGTAYLGTASTSNLTVSNIQNGILSTNNLGVVSATTSIGWNLLKGAASSLFAFDSSGNAVATTTIGANFIGGTIATINNTAITSGSAVTITAATTSLGDNNTFSGINIFNASTTFAKVINSQNASSSLNTFGSVWLPNLTASALLSLDNTGKVSASSTVGWNLLKGAASSIFAFDSSGNAIATTSIGASLLSGATAVANGGTGATSQTTNGVNYYNGTSITSGSQFNFNGTQVGIGTTTPFWNLTIASSTGPQFALTDTNPTDNAWTMRSINGIFYLATSTATATSSVSALTILNNGRVGFGTSSPGTQFSVNGVANFGGSTSTIYSNVNVVGGTTMTQATTTNLAITSIASGLLATNANGSIIPAVIGSSLSFSGNTISLNLSNPNIWTGLQQFSYASSTAISAYNQIAVGNSATTTIVGDNGTSTFSGGINIKSGCFAINGACIGYITKLAAVYSTSTVGTTTVQFTGAPGSNPTFAGGNPATLTLPSNTVSYMVEGWGGGGGGGAQVLNAAAGLGGSTCFSQSTVACNNASSTAPNALIYAGGGGGGGAANNGTGGTGGTAIMGGLNLSGAAGDPGTSNGVGGAGGNSPRGGTGAFPAGGLAAAAGITGNGPGGGGSGAKFQSGSATSTAAGGGGGAYSQNIASTSITRSGTLSVGAGGAGGTAGTLAGGAGAPGGIVITIYATSSASVAGGNDYAEMFPVSNPTIGAGDIIAVDTGTPVSMKLAQLGDKAPLAGVIATQPGQLLGDPNDPGERPVAFSGRVPTKVNLEGGPIAIGDRIAISSVPGVGKKAGIFDASVGIALASYDGTSGDGTVMTFLDLQRGLDVNSLKFALFDGNLALFGPDASSSYLSDQGSPLDFVGGMMAAIGQRLSALVSSQSQVAAVASSTNATSSTAVASSTPVDSFAASLLSGITDAVKQLLANAENGIGDIFAGTFHAKDAICVGDQCLNQDDVQTLLKLSHAPAPTTSSGGSSSGSSSSVGALIEIQGNNPATINVGDTYNDLGAIITGPAADLNLGIRTLVDGEMVDTVSIDTSIPGDHQIKYRVIDSAGNVSEKTRTVHVVGASTGDASSTPSSSSTGASSTPDTTLTQPASATSTPSTDNTPSASASTPADTSSPPADTSSTPADTSSTSAGASSDATDSTSSPQATTP